MTISKGEFLFDEIAIRASRLFAEEMEQEETWWYLSFAHDEGFRGGIFTRAQGITTALMKINRLSINPHGEVLALRIGEHDEMPQSPTMRFDLLAQNADKLITDRKELEILFGEKVYTEREFKESEKR